MKQTQTGNSMTRYSVAVDRRRKEDGTDYFNVVAFGRAAEFANNYFHQGMRVLVQGHLQTNSYTNREGMKVNTTDVIADNQEFADGKREAKREFTPDSDFVNVSADDDYGIPF